MAPDDAAALHEAGQRDTSVCIRCSEMIDAMVTLNRSAIVVTPKQPFLDGLHATDCPSADGSHVLLGRVQRCKSSKSGSFVAIF